MTKQFKTFIAGNRGGIDLEVGGEYVIIKKSELEAYTMEFLKEYQRSIKLKRFGSEEAVREYNKNKQKECRARKKLTNISNER